MLTLIPHMPLNDAFYTRINLIEIGDFLSFHSESSYKAVPKPRPEHSMRKKSMLTSRNIPHTECIQACSDWIFPTHVPETRG
ncbi:hypothetical protein CEXT_368771 [Caerostris extrusa]|uniref:Ycf15 n=1 Tax=Caerostris extrusa TaxID=172846 RepID=A0AAV4Q4S3_CAEEX|nr:hypothetical protein CEXT_368771 [Caerostris extrusa]